MAIYRGLGGAGDATVDATNNSALAATSANEAETSATSAASSATAAANSATAADTSATSAANSATNAAGSATTASTAATNASNSATDASDSADVAASSASDAAGSATAAASSASSAAAYANTASTQATNAASSASSASTSASTATAAKDAALAALDSFDDRYLGAKTTDPTLDNDGNALVPGALYYNTTDDVMKVYEGSAWVAAYASLSGALLAANNLSDLVNASSARTNLGLGTAATTAASAYATAAQGTKADSAAQPASSNTFTANQVVSVTDNTNAALRITQLGTGNALLVEDSSNPDSTPFVIDANGNVGIGTSSPLTALTFAAGSTISWGASLGSIDYAQGGSGLLAFGTGGTERIRIDSSGNVGIGTSSPASNAKLTVAGNIYLSSNTIVGSSTGSTAGTVAITGGNAFAGGGGAAIAFRGYTAGYNSGGTEFYYGNGSATIEAMRIDSSGNVGIGTNNPSSKLAVAVAAGGTSLLLTDATNSTLSIKHESPGNLLTYETGGTAQQRWVLNGTERMRIDSSGNLLVGTNTFLGSGGFSLAPNHSAGAPQAVFSRNSTTSTSYPLAFLDNGSPVGSVSYTNTATSFNTTSDYRLKDNVQPMTNALSVVQALKPVTYNWKVDGSEGQGFIAHELQAVVPDCVIGEKDAVDSDGNPVYQGIDTSFLVATLTAAIQEQQAIIETLTQRITALEQA